MLKDVNPLNINLTTAESMALIEMLQKREQYIRQGRAREAHGAGTMIWILWSSLTGAEKTETGYGGLEE